MNKKKVVIIASISLIIIYLIIIIVTFLIRNNKPEDSNKLMVSDIVATNIANTDNFSSLDTNDLGFFTGSSSATLNLAQNNNFLKTKLLTADFPLYNVDKVSGIDDKLLVRSYYYPPNSNLLNKYISGGKPTAHKKQAWFILTKKNLKSAFSPEYINVVDATLTPDGIAFLESSGNKINLVLKDNTGVYRSIGNDISAKKIIGVLGTKIYLSDYSGSIYEQNGSTYKKIISNATDVTLDHDTSKLVYSDINDSSSGEEGGFVENNKQGASSHKINILDLTTNSNTIYEPPQGYSHTDRGNIVTINKITQPDKIEIYNLGTGETLSVNIDQAASKIVDPISKVVVASKNPLILSAITNNNRLVIYSDKAIVENIASYKLPKIPVRQGQYSFDYSIVQGTVVMVADKSNTNIIANTSKILKNTCECDLNQLNKVWTVIQRTEGSL